MTGWLRRWWRAYRWRRKWVRGKLPPVSREAWRFTAADLAAWHTASQRWEALHGHQAGPHRPAAPTVLADRVRAWYDVAEATASAKLASYSWPTAPERITA